MLYRRVQHCFATQTTTMKLSRTPRSFQQSLISSARIDPHPLTHARPSWREFLGNMKSRQLMPAIAGLGIVATAMTAAAELIEPVPSERPSAAQ